ncbi:PstS family phosphate ABC transporter substrate-binding protein [Methanosalsum natronophilum]|uniref:PstS family phosphate ABC transporter substrate-binding protein n=1 Tax=Methanosalsum natronophilum TaxID=768733 RepID=A0A3R7X591_9EURY|nr:MAG: PstS family phosphate ABC transporter substrate-binding protein [Methanosalsum natronophilum]
MNHSKKIPILIVFLGLIISLSFVGCLERPDKEKMVLIKGSDTVLPLTQYAAEEFMLRNPDFTVTVIGGGSGVGIAALIDDEIEIAMSSRQMSSSELDNARNKGIELDEHEVALDGIVTIVHPENEVTSLTSNELRGIYNGSITNWKEVGGEDRRISAITRDSGSGTYQFFRDKALQGDNFRSDALSMSATGGVVQEVSQNRGSIGYVGFAYATNNVQTLSLDFDDGPIKPTVESIETETYPLVRPLYYYIQKDASIASEKFLDFLLSDEGQKLVLDIGYFRVN